MRFEHCSFFLNAKIVAISSRTVQAFVGYEHDCLICNVPCSTNRYCVENYNLIVSILFDVFLRPVKLFEKNGLVGRRKCRFRYE